MKTNKLIQKTLLSIGLSVLVASSLYAKTIDVSKSTKDIKVMTRIIAASLESSAKEFPGRPRIQGTYLATQGYLFTIQLNGISGFGVPGIASWDSGRLELDIPEIIGEAFASIDYQDVIAPDADEDFIIDIAEPVISSLEGLYDNEELKEALRTLREKQRDIRKDTYQLRREIRRSEDEKKRAQLEAELEKQQAMLKQHSEKYSNSLKTYKSERTARHIKKSVNAINAVFNTICDYGQSVRAMQKNEKFSLMIKGGVDTDGKKATQVYVIEQKALKNCSDSKKLKSNSLHYTL